MPPLPARILVTGANGNLGRQLIGRLCDSADEDGGNRPFVRALVRSEAAAEQVRCVPVASPPEILVGNYTDPGSMARAVADCGGVVHLTGIIKERRGASYESAHEDTCSLLERVSAEAGCRRIVYLSIFGARAGARNPCLNSKGLAEKILLGGRVPATVFRVPMVLGPDDFASISLRAQAQGRFVPLVGGGSTLQQPIDSRDVVNAILAALDNDGPEMLSLDLCGPECLSQRSLITRVAGLHGKAPTVVPIPRFLARIFAAAMERFSADPPITPAMLDILQHDDRLDGPPCGGELGIALTPLDDTLRAYVGPGAQKHE